MRHTPTSAEIRMILVPDVDQKTPARLRLWRAWFRGYAKQSRLWRTHSNGIHYLVDIFDGTIWHW